MDHYSIICTCNPADYQRAKYFLNTIETQLDDLSIKISLRTDPLKYGMSIYNPHQKNYSMLVHPAYDYEQVYGNAFQIAYKIRSFIKQHPLGAKSSVFTVKPKTSLDFTNTNIAVVCGPKHHKHLTKRFSNVILNKNLNEDSVIVSFGKHKEEVVLPVYHKKQDKFIAGLNVVRSNE
jgi:hypothetical protein